LQFAEPLLNGLGGRCVKCLKIVLSGTT